MHTLNSDHSLLLCFKPCSQIIYISHLLPQLRTREGHSWLHDFSLANLSSTELRQAAFLGSGPWIQTANFDLSSANVWHLWFWVTVAWFKSYFSSFQGTHLSQQIPSHLSLSQKANRLEDSKEGIFTYSLHHYFSNRNIHGPYYRVMACKSRSRSRKVVGGRALVGSELLG